MRIYTEDDFRISEAKVGDLVEEQVVDNFMDMLPPACMRSDCSQVGEPYSHRIDEKTGKSRPTFATFRRVEKGVWEYRGNCFRGENTERGEAFPYV